MSAVDVAKPLGDEFLDGAADQVIRGVPEEPFGLLVDEDDAPAGMHE